MRIKQFLTIAICMVGCSANHQYDGLYIANKEIGGITKAWILEGNELTIYSMGVINVQRCKQFASRIEIKSGETYAVDDKGDIIIVSDSSRHIDYRMVKFSDRTSYNFGELDKLVSDAYEKERTKNMQGVK